MNVFEQVKKPMASILSSPIAIVLIISTLLWMTGAPLLLNRATAASFTLMSDTLQDSDLSVATKHTIRLTLEDALSSAETLAIVFDPVGSAFSQIPLSATTTQIQTTGATIVTSCGVGGDEVTVQQTYSAGNEGIVFTVCPTDVIATSTTLTLVLGTSTPFITNPAAVGSYRIDLTGSNGDNGQTRVAIIDDVVVTASVDTTLTFTVTGMATSSIVNGETLTGSTTATAIPFGLLAPGVAKVMGQRLNVTTNAANGFQVTVVQDQNLSSATGADIDLFANGNELATPGAWTSPLNTLGNDATYGHIGVTSEDTTLSAGAEFSGSLYAGNFANARQVMFHNGVSDGSTASVGSTTVAYKIEIASLQEAGNDYQNTLTYVATPIF